MFYHVPAPDEECGKADHDQQLVPPRRYGIHDPENELKEISYKIPETCPHACFGFLLAQK
jgi:hypothetical protein